MRNFLRSLWGYINNEGGFLGPLLGAIAAPIIGGIFGQRAAAPAAQAADAAAQAQADLINTMLKQYSGVFAPAQQQIMQQYQALAGVAPGTDIATFQMLQNLLPTYMPDVLRSRAEYNIRRGQERDVTAAYEGATRRGISGAAGEALVAQARERGTQGLAGLGSNIMAWEAEQTLANRRKAFEDMLTLLGLSGEYSKVGSALPGVASQAAGNLTQQMAAAAAGAAAPWQQMGQDVGGILRDYYGRPRAPVAPAASQQYVPGYQINPGVGIAPPPAPVNPWGETEIPSWY